MTNLDARSLALSATLVATLLAVAAGPVPAQERSAPLAGSAVEERLAGIEAQLKQIVAAMAEASRYREIDVLMTRIQLKQRSLAPVESELRSARSERKGAVDEREHMRIFMEEWEQNMNGAAPGSEEREAMAAEIDRARRQFELMEDRERELDQRILELENDLGRMRDDILTLEEQVDERLGLR